MKSDSVVFEVEDNYQKQTYRNRCYVYGANGILSLNVPVKHTKTTRRKKTKDTLIENNFPWQNQHFKSLKTAYRSSPYFEFFENDISSIFHKRYIYLIDLNIDTYLFVTEALQLTREFSKTNEYQIAPKLRDYRNFSIVKKGISVNIDEYPQVFSHNHGFISNLSILDLLFMEGFNALIFLENITI